MSIPLFRHPREGGDPVIISGEAAPIDVLDSHLHGNDDFEGARGA